MTVESSNDVAVDPSEPLTEVPFRFTTYEVAPAAVVHVTRTAAAPLLQNVLDEAVNVPGGCCGGDPQDETLTLAGEEVVAVPLPFDAVTV